MGEFVAVLNGVEFRTRHNDYRLFMPSTTSNSYHAKENVPFPQVPPEVLQYTEVDDQVIINTKNIRICMLGYLSACT